MRKLGEQWVEEIDGDRHLAKLSKSNFKEIGTCGGCIHHSWYEGDWCDVAPSKPCGEVGFIIKDLGILNEDGCLPSAWDKALYPQVYRTTETIWYAYAESYGILMEAKGKTKQEAIDAWNRRA